MQGEFADKFNSMPKYVVSSTHDQPRLEQHHRASASTTSLDVSRRHDGGPIQVAGSATLAQGLHRAGLVDQWNLMVFPVILGSGRRLFPTDVEDKQKLQLTESKTYSNGVQAQVFRRA